MKKGLNWESKKRMFKMVKEDPMNIWYFIQGYYRYWLRNTWLIRKHIKEQFEYRLKNTNSKCIEQGSCVVCTCKVPELLMADKPCSMKKIPIESRMFFFGNDKICFEKMLNKKDWQQFKIENEL